MLIFKDLPVAGSAGPEVTARTQQVWAEEAAKAGVDLSGYKPAAPLADRINWATRIGLLIGGILSRFSSKMQHSTDSQVQDCTRFAAWHGMYIPPEFVCVDEAVSGRKVRRAGLDRMRTILAEKMIGVLLVFKVSRLFRHAYRGFQLVNEEVVEEGLRAISVSQGIDTADEKSWKPLMCLHGLMDEMLLSTIADHVRSGIVTLFAAGYVTGALTVGYEPVEVPGASPTNQGKPRKMPRVVADVAAMIMQHYEWIRDGMSIKEGRRRWVKDGGSCDPRSTLKVMAYDAYRRLLSNPRYIGRWAFGRKKNSWSSKRDYTRQVVQPDTEVTVCQVDELRIISDELFFAVQERLAKFKLGHRGPRTKKNPQLWDLVTGCFFCPICKTRYYQAGANGHAMQCKNRDLCPCTSIVRRKESVVAVCQKLTELIAQDTDLITQIVARAGEIDAAGDQAVGAEIVRLERQISGLSKKIDDLTELAGQGTDDDRAAMKSKTMAAMGEKAGLQRELAGLKERRDKTAATITPEQVRKVLADLTQLLLDGAAGKLGEDVVHRAAAVFEMLVDGRINVHVEQRAGRKRTNVRAVFTTNLIHAVKRELGEDRPGEVHNPDEVEVWLRKPPKLDLLASRVHELVDIQGLSLREAAKVLQGEGFPKMNSGNAWQSHRRYYEMLGQSAPNLGDRHRQQDDPAA